MEEADVERNEPQRERQTVVLFPPFGIMPSVFRSRVPTDDLVHVGSDMDMMRPLHNISIERHDSAPRFLMPPRNPNSGTPFDVLYRVSELYNGAPVQVQQNSDTTHHHSSLNEEAENMDEDDDTWEETVAATEGVDIPKEFICPITLAPMQHPVVAQDGVSYERVALVKWLRTNKDFRSPATNCPMGNQFIPNRNLKLCIREFLAQKHKEVCMP